MRKIYIIPKDEPITEDMIATCKASDCGEIVNGIPPRLESVIEDKNLPCFFTEIIADIIPERNLEAEIDELKARVLKLEIAAEPEPIS